MDDKNFSTENSQILMYQSEDGQSCLDVRLKNESVWLTQAMMAQFFGVDHSVISRHLKNIFDEGELDKAVVCAEIAHATIATPLVICCPKDNTISKPSRSKILRRLAQFNRQHW